MLNIAVLVSGGGTNLQAIIDAVESGKITNTKIGMVFSNNRNAYALERAAKHGIKTEVLVPKEFENRDAFNEAFYNLLISENPDLIVLAGCLVVIPEKIVKAFSGRIINIHPSLIPSFCGTGFYGLKVHEKALERGVRVSGATVHFVDEGTDTGPIILQKPVMIRPDDTAKTLQQRIMEQAEWKILPKAIDLIANGKVKVVDGKVVIEGYDPDTI
ncbi:MULTISPECIES: phosphoribosylglycinamide formyltransferase [unclassified Butyrivibrio]|uniref:phosphoribosylglycinamide formyltransferase n=1 Tax=unclassified Butyrivibrio TaxID=2639466 RepID=UPI0003B63545|nr:MULTISPECIES: phosphoribosylglycinamide formyltransferase [unclassified Butyrivibrio]SEK73008.1 phosphoribosylglycinamide formyltransferase-1 [Butyrivibrio sp. ob235]